jgi:hypothetical protein
LGPCFCVPVESRDNDVSETLLAVLELDLLENRAEKCIRVMEYACAHRRMDDLDTLSRRACMRWEGRGGDLQSVLLDI